MRRCLLAFALVCAACGEHVVWYGRAPDHATEVRVLERGGNQRVVVGGRADASHDAVGVEGLVFAGRARAYPVLDRGRWSIVRDGLAQPGSWEAIGDVRLSPDGRHLAFAALAGGQWSVHSDGVAGPPFQRLERRSLHVGDDGRTSYVAERADGVSVLDGERAMGPYRAIRGLHREGADLVWVARVAGGESVVRGARSSETFDTISEWVNGGFVGRRAGSYVVEILGRRAHAGTTPAGALAVSGSHYSFALDTPDSERLVQDGVVGEVSFDAVLSTAWTSAGRLCFVAERGGRVFVVAGSAEPSGPWDSVGPLVVSAARDRLAFVAHRGDDAIVVVDGIERGAWASASPPIFSADGARWAYVGSMGGGAVLVDDRGRKAFDVVLADTLVFDARERVGAIVGFASNRSVWVTIDRTPRVRVDLAEWVAEVQRAGTLDPRSWVEAELARAP